MELGTALLLGVVQGLTEFLPISSSGHLVLLQHLLPFTLDHSRFDTLLHAGTLLSIFIYYRNRLLDLTRGMLSRDAASWRYAGLLITGTIPTALISLLFHHPLEKLFDQPQGLWYQFFLSGTVLLFAFWLRGRARKIEITIPQAFIIGVAQGAAIIPALSRSGLTVGAAMLLGIQPKVAAEYSFLLGIPAMLGAVMIELKPSFLTGAPLVALSAGFLAAFISGIVAVAFFVHTLVQGTFFHFALYCFAMGILSLFLFPPW